MFQDYTVEELIGLRSLCMVHVEETDDLRTRADLLLILQFIDEELTLRHRVMAA